MGKKKPTRQGNAFTVWLPTEIDQRLQAFLDNQLVAPTKKAVIVKALEEFLDRHETQVSGRDSAK